MDYETYLAERVREVFRESRTLRSAWTRSRNLFSAPIAGTSETARREAFDGLGRWK